MANANPDVCGEREREDGEYDDGDTSCERDEWTEHDDSLRRFISGSPRQSMCKVRGGSDTLIFLRVAALFSGVNSQKPGTCFSASC